MPKEKYVRIKMPQDGDYIVNNKELSDLFKDKESVSWEEIASIAEYEPDIDVCPRCKGYADNGFDRCLPPSPYVCTKCEEEDKHNQEILNEEFEKTINSENLSRQKEFGLDYSQIGKQNTAYDIWHKWFNLCCDHNIDPQGYEAWNGAVDTVMLYISNELCGEADYSLKEIDELVNKVKNKFKV